MNEKKKSHFYIKVRVINWNYAIVHDQSNVII